MENRSDVIKIKSGFIIEKVGDGFLAVAVGDRADEFTGLIRMNGTGAFLWKLCEDEPKTKAQLLAAVLDEYAVDEKTAAKDIDKFEEQLRLGGILE